MIVEVTCPDCHGKGYYVEGEHGCGGNDEICQVRCPVPIQVQCELCKGEGLVEAFEDEGEDKR